MNPAQRAQKVINQAIEKLKLPIANVWCFNWPPNAEINTQETDILITEVNDAPTNYGSNHSNMMLETVAVNIIYDETNEDYDAIEQPLLNAFEDQGWFCDYSPGHTVDPDTFQVTKIFRFKHKIRKEVL